MMVGVDGKLINWRVCLGPRKTRAGVRGFGLSEG